MFSILEDAIEEWPESNLMKKMTTLNDSTTFDNSQVNVNNDVKEIDTEINNLKDYENIEDTELNEENNIFEDYLDVPEESEQIELNEALSLVEFSIPNEQLEKPIHKVRDIEDF